jgi:hypothetical protein
MGYLIEPGFLTTTVVIQEADFQGCGTTPVLLLQGKPGIVFQLFSVMAKVNFPGNYLSASPYTIIGNINGLEVAATHFDNFNGYEIPCIYSIGVNPSTDNAQKAGNNLDISTRSGADPTGTGDVTFKIVYRELSF